jgi:hypothetical protein
MEQNALPILLAAIGPEVDLLELTAYLKDLSEEDWQNLIQLAGKLGVGGVFYYRIKIDKLDSLVPSNCLATLRQQYLNNDARNLINKLELVKIAKAFQAHEIPLIVLKGAFLAEFVYPDSAMRGMTDVDIMVRVNDLSRAAEVLVSLGYQSKDDYFVENIPSTAHHLPGFFKKGGPRIELHWTILTLEDRRPIDIQVLWKRAVPVRISDADMLALCPEDLLLHICGHASYHHTFEVGLRALYDVKVIIDRYQKELDWPGFIQYTRDWHWERGVYIVLQLAKDLLGAAVPEEVLLSLMPPDFNETTLETAKAQILGMEGAAGMVTVPLANWHTASFPGKIAIFWRRLFLSKPYLAARFGISPASPLIYFYYPVRFFDLLIRYGKTTYHLWRGTAASVSFVERKAQLQDWLNKD